MSCACATIVVVESSEYYATCVCVCSLKYPACKAHAPYSYLWPVPLYDIFPHYLINDTIFFLGGGDFIEHKMCVSSFSTILSETFFILRQN